MALSFILMCCKKNIGGRSFQSALYSFYTMFYSEINPLIEKPVCLKPRVGCTESVFNSPSKKMITPVLPRIVNIYYFTCCVTIKKSNTTLYIKYFSSVLLNLNFILPFCKAFIIVITVLFMNSHSTTSYGCNLFNPISPYRTVTVPYPFKFLCPISFGFYSSKILIGQQGFTQKRLNWPTASRKRSFRRKRYESRINHPFRTLNSTGLLYRYRRRSPAEEDLPIVSNLYPYFFTGYPYRE